MKNKLKYLHISDYNSFKKKLNRRGATYDLIETSYTKQIKKQNKKFIFNNDGRRDSSILYLINNVRSDAKEYLKNVDEFNDEYIHFFDLLSKPPENKIISKIDINSAYWQFALNKGIVSPYTNELFEAYYEDKDASIAKKARLKALGSLATTKRKITYKNGKPDYDTEQINTEPTKPLYMEICRGINNIMQKCVAEIPGCHYYYWDCIFVSHEFSEDVIQFFKEMGYNSKINETKIEVEKVGNIHYLVSKSDDKIYMVRKEDSHLLI